jgi:hypothetical protein
MVYAQKTKMAPSDITILNSERKKYTRKATG